MSDENKHWILLKYLSKSCSILSYQIWLISELFAPPYGENYYLLYTHFATDATSQASCCFHEKSSNELNPLFTSSSLPYM